MNDALERKETDSARRNIEDLIRIHLPRVCNFNFTFSLEPDDKYHRMPTPVADFFRDTEEKGYGLHFCDNYLFIIGNFEIEVSQAFHERLDKILVSLSDKDKLDVPSIVLLDACPNDTELYDHLFDTLDHAVSKGYPRDQMPFLLNVLNVSLDGCGYSGCERCGDSIEE